MLVRLVKQFPHVVGKSRNPQETGLLVQQALHFLNRETFFGGDKIENRSVEVAGASAHHKPLERSESHRSVHGLALANRGGRATVSQVERNDVGFLRRKASELTVPIGDVAV